MVYKLPIKLIVSGNVLSSNTVTVTLIISLVEQVFFSLVFVNFNS